LPILLLGLALVGILGVGGVLLAPGNPEPNNEVDDEEMVVAEGVELDETPPVAIPADRDIEGTPTEDVTPPSGASIVLRIRVEPESARLRVDEVDVEGNPFVGRFRRDGAQHRVDASAPGHEDQSLFVTFDRDQELELTLERTRRTKRLRQREEESPPVPEPKRGRFDRDNPYGGS